MNKLYHSPKIAICFYHNFFYSESLVAKLEPTLCALFWNCLIIHNPLLIPRIWRLWLSQWKNWNWNQDQPRGRGEQSSVHAPEPLHHRHQDSLQRCPGLWLHQTPLQARSVHQRAASSPHKAEKRFKNGLGRSLFGILGQSGCLFKRLFCMKFVSRCIFGKGNISLHFRCLFVTSLWPTRGGFFGN